MSDSSLLCPGFTHDLGAFHVNFYQAPGAQLVDRPTHLVGKCLREDALVPAITSALKLRPDFTSVYLTGRQLVADNEMEAVINQMEPNLWVTEVSVEPKSQKTTAVLEVEFVSQASTSSDAVSMTGDNFDKVLAQHSRKFHEKFQQRFPHNPKTRTDEQVRHHLFE